MTNPFRAGVLVLLCAPLTLNADDNSFNPAISLLLQGSLASYSEEPDSWALPGFQLGGETGLKSEGLSLTETELTLSANLDSWFFAQATLGMHEHEGETETEIEEAFADTLALPGGFGLRFGRFYAEAGYTNSRHSHAWDFADAPLVSQAFLGKQYGDDGLRLSWLAPTALYIETGIEAFRGEGFPAAAEGDEALGGAHNLYLRLGDDVGERHSYQIGLSHLRATPIDRGGADTHNHDETDTHGSFFSGDSDLTILDLVWKWALDGDLTGRHLTLQAEYFQRDEDGEILLQEASGSAAFDYEGIQRGFYLQGVYRFRPDWRVGIRYDRLWTDNRLALTANTTGEDGDELAAETGLVSDHKPERWSLMADWSPSEFSRLRLQVAHDASRPELSDRQLQLQYILTLGAHGAHRY
jgi:hypothetical protein